MRKKDRYNFQKLYKIKKSSNIIIELITQAALKMMYSIILFPFRDLLFAHNVVNIIIITTL